jgi:hypothetical protein
VTAKADAKTNAIQVELKAKQEQGDRPLKRIEVWGDRAQIGVDYSATVTSKDGTGRGSGSTPAGQGEKIILTYLEIEETKCGFVSGHLDSTWIRELVRKGLPGYDMRVIENTWKAQRDDRDEALEKKVQELVDQPIPAQLSWGYLDEFTRKAGEIRKSAKKDDYSRCVLKALEGKFVGIGRAFMKDLGKNFPNAELEPSCEVLRQAMLPLLEMQRSLELYGAGGCPESAEAWGNVEKQVQRTVGFLLQQKPGFLRLSCMKSLDTAGLMGDASTAFNEALKAAEIQFREGK